MTSTFQVLDWIKTHVGQAPNVILTPIFKDYQRHLTELRVKFNVDETPTSSPAKIVSASPASTGSKPTETSFKFGNGSTAATTTTSPAFSFGSGKKSDFSFGGTASTVSDSAKTGTSVTSEPAKTGFSFGSFSGASTFGLETLLFVVLVSY